MTDDRDLGPARFSADRVLLTVLLAVNGILLLAVPVAGVRMAMILLQSPPGRFPAWFPPALFLALGAFELLLLWRFRSIRRRLSRAQEPRADSSRFDG